MHQTIMKSVFYTPAKIKIDGKKLHEYISNTNISSHNAFKIIAIFPIKYLRVFQNILQLDTLLVHYIHS